jgi:prepilin-type N-terminal cleavage/methylation domain-containing protein
MNAFFRQRAFTLVELMVTLTITSFALLASAPYLSDWTYGRQIKDAQSKLLRAYGLAKSLAVRNPAGAQSNDPAAGLKLETVGSDLFLYVCKGDPDSAACDGADTNGVLVWKADFPAAIVLKLGTNIWAAGTAATTATTLAINNRGFPTSGKLNTYKLSRGGDANDVFGPLP